MRRSFSNYIETPLTIVALLVAWHLITVLFRMPEYILPSPITVFEHLFVKQPNANYAWAKHINATLLEVLLAFIATGLIGFLISVAISWSNFVRELSMPVLILMNSLPTVALAPLLLLWFGYGLGTNVLIGFLVAFFPMVINVTQGLSRVEDDLLDLVGYLHATKLQVFLKVRLPKSLPYLFSGLKISATMVVVGAIVGEFIASDKGLGYIIINSQYTMTTPPIFGALLLISLIGTLLYGLVALAEWYFMPWRRGKGLEA